MALLGGPGTFCPQKLNSSLTKLNSSLKAPIETQFVFILYCSWFSWYSLKQFPPKHLTPHLKAKLASPKRHFPMTRIGFWLKRLKLVQTPEKKYNCPHACPETYLVCCWNYHTAFLSSTVSVQSISALIVAKLLQLIRTSQEVLCWLILRQRRLRHIHRMCCLGGVGGLVVEIVALCWVAWLAALAQLMFPNTGLPWTASVITQLTWSPWEGDHYSDRLGNNCSLFLQRGVQIGSQFISMGWSHEDSWAKLGSPSWGP